jgi:hypothetical protein
MQELEAKCGAANPSVEKSPTGPRSWGEGGGTVVHAALYTSEDWNILSSCCTVLPNIPHSAEDTPNSNGF